MFYEDYEFYHDNSGAAVDGLNDKVFTDLSDDSTPV